jgi:predicted esterase
MSSAPLAVVTVHGRSLDPAYMIANVVQRLGRLDLSYVLPAADANSWYPTTFLAPLNDNQPRLDFALERMQDARQLINDAGVEDERILWLGFSQGACLVTEFVARSHERFAGLICFTGGLIGPSFDDLTRPSQVTNMPVFMTVSDRDEWIPLERASDSAAIFQEAGADLEFVVTANTAHEVVDDAIERARSLLEELSSPRS